MFAHVAWAQKSIRNIHCICRSTRAVQGRIQTHNFDNSSTAGNSHCQKSNYHFDYYYHCCGPGDIGVL